MRSYACALLVLACSCSTPERSAPDGSTGPVGRSLAAAADEAGVPRGLLATLALGASLTGTTEEHLRADTDLATRAGARALAQLGAQTGAGSTLASWHRARGRRAGGGGAGAGAD